MDKSATPDRDPVTQPAVNSAENPSPLPPPSGQRSSDSGRPASAATRPQTSEPPARKPAGLSSPHRVRTVLATIGSAGSRRMLGSGLQIVRSRSSNSGLSPGNVAGSTEVMPTLFLPTSPWKKRIGLTFVTPGTAIFSPSAFLAGKQRGRVTRLLG